jgi:uncharacterized damage-inducible protein DinB
MPGYSKKVERQFRNLDQKKSQLMERLLALPKETYDTQPSSGGWSAGQAANHIYLSEQLSLAYLKKKLSYPETVPPFHIKSWVATWLLKFTLRTPYKAKAPKAINMWEQQVVLGPVELNEKWDLLRSDLKAFVEKNDQAFGSHLVYKHPYAGRMTMYQMLIFFNDHMAHHMRQIDRIIKQQIK